MNGTNTVSSRQHCLMSVILSSSVNITGCCRESLQVYGSIIGICTREGFHSRDVMVVVGFLDSVLSSEDAGHRDWQNVRKNNLQNMAKQPEKPTTTIIGIF